MLFVLFLFSLRSLAHSLVSAQQYRQCQQSGESRAWRSGVSPTHLSLSRSGNDRAEEEEEDYQFAIYHLHSRCSAASVLHFIDRQDTVKDKAETGSDDLRREETLDRMTR